MSSVTPAMGLIIPDPLVTPGPEYAQEVNTSLETIDTHSHLPSSGVPITTAAIQINADLPFNNYNGINYRTVRFNLQVAAPSDPLDINAVTSVNGELTYIDNNGNVVQITNNGSVAGATGTITGLVSPASASFSPITDSFTFNFNTGKPGKLNVSDINLYKFNDVSGANLTLKWAPASPVSYEITMPAGLATDDSVAKTSAAGIQIFSAAGIVPIGGMVAVASNLPGSFFIPPSGTKSRGWQVCDGAAVAAGSILSGVVPQLSDDRFLMGGVGPGVTGGANSQTTTHEHSHIFDHTHAAIGIDSDRFLKGALSSDSSTTAPGTTTFGGVQIMKLGTTGLNYNMLISTEANSVVYTSGVVSAPSGSGSTATTRGANIITTDAWDNRPKFLSTTYLIRVE